MVSPPAPVTIGVVGSGWRAEYYLRVAQQLPDFFTVGAVLVRSDESAARIAAAWGLPVVTDLRSFLDAGPYDYVTLAVPSEVASRYMVDLAAADVPVLTETPPARDVSALNAQYRAIGGAAIQVAEQYQFQAHHAARMAVARSGLLGEVHTAYVSAAHDYHAMALIRQALTAGFGPVEISGRIIADRVQSARGRDDWRDEVVETDARRVFAWLDFDGGGLGIYDFLDEQYVSPIRSRTLRLSGPRGELTNDHGAYLADVGRAAPIDLSREATGADGDLEGFFLRRIVDGATVLWENEYPRARLNDDELAVARVMGRMAEYVRTGTPFYSLADGSHDSYLGALVAEATTTGRTVRSEPQAWSHAVSVFAE